MLLKEQYTFEVRSSSFTKENKLQSENILYWFQEAASQHSEQFHIGFHDLIKDNIIWMVARNKYEILSDFSKQYSAPSISAHFVGINLCFSFE